MKQTTIILQRPTQNWLKAERLTFDDGSVKELGISSIQLPYGEDPPQPNLMVKLYMKLLHPLAHYSYEYFTLLK